MKSPRHMGAARERSPAQAAAGWAEDRELIARLLARDQSAFASLVRAQHESLVRLALVFVANRATAEEVAHLSWKDAVRFQLHLGMCRHCRRYLRDMKVTVRVLGALPVGAIPGETMDALMERFRNW